MDTLKQAQKNIDINFGITIIRTVKHLNSVCGLIIPGGESTTISRILQSSGLYDAISERIQKQDLCVLGTCAGSVLLAREIKTPQADVKLLQTIDMQVERNAFGRQKDSFEQEITFNHFTRPFPAVFIRAPVITKIWGSCKPLARLDNKIIAVQQGRLMACVFHPELTSDSRVHEYFIQTVY